MSEGTKAELVDVFGLLLPHLDERQQRLTLGAAARVLGHGGMDPHGGRSGRGGGVHGVAREAGSKSA